MPKISIIMPMLNSAQYLRECMDSVLHQSLKDIEVIVVDGGSTDGTLELLKEYAGRDCRIHIIHSDRRSAGYQYNLGIEAARGDYIGFVESDDYVPKTMYEILLEYAVSNQVDWVKADYFYFMDYPEAGRQKMPVHDEKYCPVNQVFVPQKYPKQYVQEIFMWRGIYNTQFVKTNKILLNETPGASFQDTGFVLQAFMYAAKALYIDECLYCYRRDHQGSSSHQAGTIRYEIDEVEYISDIIEKDQKLRRLFWNVNYKRAWCRFLTAYERVPQISECPDEIFCAVKRYRNYLLEEQRTNEAYWEVHELSDQFRELVWLKEGLDMFDKEYRILEKAEEDLLRKKIRKILDYKKVIVFGCGDNGSGIVSLLLRLNRNEIICLSDNDECRWNTEYMGRKVLPPKLLKVDQETAVIIANRRYYYEIRAQLIELGIPDRQILLCPQIMRYRGTNLLPEGDILPIK